jgi:hypothetical protein
VASIKVVKVRYAPNLGDRVCGLCPAPVGSVAREYRLAHPSVPPGVQRSECLTPPPQTESGTDWFVRLGGRAVRHPNAQWQGHPYTGADIAQGRNLNKYDKFELTDPDHPHPSERWRNPVLAEARTFLWEHWRNRKRAYLMTLSSVDHTGTSHVFVEPDDSGRWRAYRRQLDRQVLVDEPTVYSVTWVIPNGLDKPGTSLLEGQAPDSLIHELELRDVCGERTGHF